MAEENPTWDLDVNLPTFSQLKSDIETEVAIIGGGITGITTAYLLSEAGKKVVLIEKNSLCSGATGVTTAFLTQNIDTDLRKLVKMFGEKKTALISKAHQFAISLVQRIIRKNKIECEFKKCSNFYYATSENSKKLFEKNEKIAKRLGIPAELKFDDSLNFKNYGYIEFKNQAKFHPLKYLSALAKICVKNGVEIFEKTEVERISGIGPFAVRTKKGRVFADYVVVATYAPFDHELYFKRAFYDSYVMELELTQGVLKEGIYEDDLEPYHYFRVDKKEKSDRVIIGGEDHRSDIPVNPSKSFQALEEYARKLFRHIKLSIVRKWSGPILETIDGLAYIGEHKMEKIFYATGFSGNGMTYGTLAAKIISNSILRKKDSKIQAFAEIYDARRVPTLKQLANKGADYSREMFGGALKNTLKYRVR